MKPFSICTMSELNCACRSSAGRQGVPRSLLERAAEPAALGARGGRAGVVERRDLPGELGPPLVGERKGREGVDAARSEA